MTILYDAAHDYRVRTRNWIYSLRTAETDIEYGRALMSIQTYYACYRKAWHKYIETINASEKRAKSLRNVVTFVSKARKAHLRSIAGPSVNDMDAHFAEFGTN